MFPHLSLSTLLSLTSRERELLESGYTKEAEGPAAMGIKLYYTTVTASRTVKSQQAEVIRILDSKSIQYELIDISVGGELRDEMRNKAGDPSAVPPQLFNEDQYCGNYEMLSEAVEADTVDQFLKIA
ncbi:SH3 domain-binding glutamic acid-rich-like protein 3 [Labrus bergylta]|nr:SH3 domain-binding glutamic acid-rich-like protein 3 [Labrus bergylta]